MSSDEAPLSSAASPDARVGELIERLLVDAGFRAEFRSDPVGCCRALGLDGLAQELGAGRGVLALESRESKSSLAGVVMALAAEGVAVGELQGLLAGHGHGLSGADRRLLATAHVKAPRGPRLGSGLLGRGGRGLPGGGHPSAPGATSSAPGSGAASAGAGSPGAATAGGAQPGPAVAIVHGPQTPPPTTNTAGGAPHAPWPTAPPTAAPGTVTPADADAAQPLPTANPATSTASPSGQPFPTPGATPGPSTANAVALLQNPRLQMPASAQTLFTSGQADPRLTTLLQTTLNHHTITLATATQTTDPIHAQAIDITAVDGQPIGPTNFAARDLITEIAALDPTTRPNEITTPWPIAAQGFFTDPQHPDRLHLAFTSPTDYQPTTPGAAATPSASPPEQPPLTPTPTTGPTPDTPAAQGAAHAAAQALTNPPPTTTPAAANPTTPPTPSAATPASQHVPTAGTGAAGAGAAAAVGAGAGIPGDPFFASAKAHAVFESAKSQLGVHYQWGGTSPQTGFDCSGLMQWAYAQHGISIPRVAADQFHSGTAVDLAHLKEGDLVFFQDSTGYIHHVGMYVGNHMFLEAPHTGDVVKYDSLNSPYWAQQFAGGRRIVPLDSTAATPSAGPSTSAGPVQSAAPSATSADAVQSVAPAATPTGALAGQGAAGVGAAGAGAVGAAAPGSPQVAGVPAAGAVEVTTPGAPQVAAAPAAAAAPRPGTAVFKALQRQEQSFHRHTAMFLAAIKPEQVNPIPAAPAGASPPSGGVPAQATGLAAGPASAVPATAIQPGSGSAGQLVGQVSGSSISGGVLSVSSSLLTPGQEKFVAKLAQLTGLDPKVLSAWCLAEESGGAAQGREAAGNFNWLNIGYFDSGAGAIAFNQEFGNPVSAAEQTARFLRGTWGGASSGIQNIMHSVGHAPDQQIMAISTSGWASTGYHGGADLRGTFNELGDLQVTKA